MVGCPGGCGDEGAGGFEEGADGESVVCCAWAGEGGVDVGVDEEGVLFACVGAVGDAEDDVGEVDVVFVEALAEDVEAVGAAADLVPDLALQIRIRTAEPLELVRLLEHPFVPLGVLQRPDSPIPNLLRQNPCVLQNRPFRHLGHLRDVVPSNAC